MSYRCNYCGKEYEKVIDRANCEINCNQIFQEKLDQENRLKLKFEENMRLKEIQNAYRMFTKLVTEFEKEYVKKKSKSNEFLISLINVFDLMGS